VKLFKQPGQQSNTEDRAAVLEMWETWAGGKQPQGLTTGFTEYVNSGLKATGAVFACVLVRMQLVSQARFYWRDYPTGERLEDGVDMAGLGILRRPWPNGSTSDLTAIMEMDASLAGNAYIHRATKPEGGFTLQRLRPDWVSVVPSTDRTSIDGYIYNPGGLVTNRSTVIPVKDVGHYMPLPDPVNAFRGMSWMTPVARSINNVVDFTDFQSQYLAQSATPNLLVKVMGKLAPEQRTALQQQLDRKHSGVGNAGRTMLLEGGADATLIGGGIDRAFTMSKAAAENEIASASGVPAILAGLKEGLQAATYSNAAQARRVFAMGTGRFLLEQTAETLATILPSKPKETAELWYDQSRISWFNEDATETAAINQARASTMETLIRAGYEPDGVAKAVTTGDYSSLVHTGLTSVQLQPPGESEPEPESNGAGTPAQLEELTL
jgi:phage portal protein BeeE